MWKILDQIIPQVPESLRSSDGLCYDKETNSSDSGGKHFRSDAVTFARILYPFLFCFAFFQYASNSPKMMNLRAKMNINDVIHDDVEDQWRKWTRSCTIFPPHDCLPTYHDIRRTSTGQPAVTYKDVMLTTAYHDADHTDDWRKKRGQRPSMWCPVLLLLVFYQCKAPWIQHVKWVMACKMCNTMMGIQPCNVSELPGLMLLSVCRSTDRCATRVNLASRWSIWYSGIWIFDNFWAPLSSYSLKTMRFFVVFHLGHLLHRLVGSGRNGLKSRV